MTFYDIFKAVPVAIEEAMPNLDKAIDHLLDLRKATEDEAEIKEIDVLIQKVNDTMKFTHFMGNKIQTQLKFLSFHMKDSSTPVDVQPMDDKRTE